MKNPSQTTTERRKGLRIPKAVKLLIRLKRKDAEGRPVCGCGCGGLLPPFETKRGTVYDHRPACQDRKWNARKRDFIPAYADPAYLDAILPACSDRLTFGAGGELRITTRGGDLGEKAHEKAMRDKYKEFRLAMTQKRPGKPRMAKSRIPARPFPKGSKGLRRLGK